MTAASTSRLATMANQRRQRRQQQQQSDKTTPTKTKPTKHHTDDSQPKHDGNNTVTKYQQQHDISCAPTSSMTFDDSTISSHWSKTSLSNQSTITEESFNFALGTTETVSAVPNKKPAQQHNKAPIDMTADRKLSMVVTTPRRRNTFAKKLRNGTGAINNTSTFSTGTTAAKNSVTKTKTGGTNKSKPLKENAEQKDDSSSVISSSSTMKSASSISASDPEYIKAECDKLKLDIVTYKRKLQSATEAKNKAEHTTKDKDSRISKLEQRLQTMEKELELSKESLGSAELQIKEYEEGNIIDGTTHTKEVHELQTKLNETLLQLGTEQEHNEQLMNDMEEEKKYMENMNAAMEEELNSMQSKLNETSSELTRVQQQNETLTTNKQSMDGSLKKELNEMESEKEYVEGQWKECLTRLEIVEMECQAKDANQSQLNQCIQTLQEEKRRLINQSKQQQSQLSNLFADKQSLEKSYQDQISDMQTEVQLQRASTDNMKHHHAKVIEGLKSDLAKARQLREESTSSLQQDMSTMKSEYDDNINYYKNEVDNLRTQLRNMKQRMDNERKDWMKVEDWIKYEDKMIREKESLTEQLVQTRANFEKDTELLESESDKTYKAKVELEAELKDTKRQLHNALRNLDEMALDGGKMRSDLEGVVSDFSKEKSHYQHEITHWKDVSEERKHKLEEVSREKEELRKSVTTLEAQLELARDEHDSNKQYEVEDLLVEVQYLKNKLQKAEADASHFSTPRAENELQLSEQQSQITQLQTEKHQLTIQITQHTEVIEHLKSTQRESSAELSRAQQTIQILKSKERYLESRVESLANQITKTVRDYEMRLTCSSSAESNGR